MKHEELRKEEIIKKLELHPSRLDKEKIIFEAMEHRLNDFFEGITMALDPLVTFGVKQVPEKKEETSGQGCKSVSYTHLTLPTIYSV